MRLVNFIEFHGEGASINCQVYICPFPGTEPALEIRVLPAELVLPLFRLTHWEVNITSSFFVGKYFKDNSLNNSTKSFSDLHCVSLSMPYQHSGYIPLEAGKYYWIEALHKEGQRRDSLSVGYTLECPNTSPVLSETPILKPSLQYKIPSKLKLAKLQNVGVLTSDLTKLLPSRNIIDLKVHTMGLLYFSV